MTSVAIAGVLSVWSWREFAAAVRSDSDSGTQRVPLLSTSSARASASGEHSASHRPPSDPKTFCGAK